jgi:hypothetical protein
MCWWGLAARACRCRRECLRGEVLGDGGGAGELTCRRRRCGRSSRPPVPCEPAVFLFVLSAGLGDSERTPARAGWALGWLDVVWEALGNAMRGDCSRRWDLLEGCCPESCSWDRQLQAGGGSFRNFGGFAEILGLLGLPGRARLRHSERAARWRRLQGQP